MKRTLGEHDTCHWLEHFSLYIYIWTVFIISEKRAIKLLLKAGDSKIWPHWAWKAYHQNFVLFQTFVLLVILHRFVGTLRFLCIRMKDAHVLASHRENRNYFSLKRVFLLASNKPTPKIAEFTQTALLLSFLSQFAQHVISKSFSELCILLSPLRTSPWYFGGYDSARPSALRTYPFSELLRGQMESLPRTSSRQAVCKHMGTLLAAVHNITDE